MVHDLIIKDLQELEAAQAITYDKIIVADTIKLLFERSPLEVAYAISEDLYGEANIDTDILRTILYRLWEDEQGKREKAETEHVEKYPIYRRY